MNTNEFTGASRQSQTGRFCKLLRPVRDREGHAHFLDQPQILGEIDNLDRHMYLVRFGDGATTFVFPHEVAIVDEGRQAA